MLIVGIENEEGQQMFDESENDFLRSFEMGAIAMAAGVGRIADEGYTRVVTVGEAAFRFRTVARDLLKDNEDGSPFTDEFVQRMADAGWSANVGLEPFETWCIRRARSLITRERDWYEDPHYYRMTVVYDGMVDTWDAMDKMVKRIVTNPTVRGRELHHLIPDHMFDRTLSGSKELRWDDFQEVALLVDEDGYPEHTGDDE